MHACMQHFDIEATSILQPKFFGPMVTGLLRFHFTADLPSYHLPTVVFPHDWHATFRHNHNHWANEETMIDYLQKILIPYVDNKRKLLKLRDDYLVLVLFDHYSGQMTESVLKLLDENHIHRVAILANCTDYNR